MTKISNLLKLFFFLFIIVTQAQTEDCLTCHSDESLTYTRNGREVSLFVNSERFLSSTHGDFDCNFCHENFDAEDIPHREGEDIYKVNCGECHDEIYSAVQNDIHHRLDERVSNPPTCITCHDYHYVKPPDEVPDKVREYCSDCHESVVLMRPFHKIDQSTGDECSDCHDTQDFKPQLTESVHKDLICNDCHSVIANNLEEHPVNTGKMEIANCFVCHSDIAEEHKESIHGISLEQGIDEAATCWDCHGSHDIQPTDKPESMVSPNRLGETCGTCHDDPEFAKKFDLINVRTNLKFEDSFHYTLFRERGIDDVEITCSTCHGVHDIKNRIQPGSRISTAGINETCSQCHAEVVHEYENSIHWIKARKGLRVSPICSDCHSEHSQRAKDLAEGKFSHQQFQEEICISCHQDPILTSRLGLSQEEAYSYQDSYHGLAVQRGDPNAAYCIDCHSTHKILPEEHPESSVNDANVLETCQKCHTDATPIFAQSYSHITQNEEARKVEGVVTSFYFWMIVLVIGGMVLHNILIFVFELRKRKSSERKEVVIPRFTTNEVVQHIILFTSFFALAITGFALKYPQSWWADGLYQLGMTESVRQLIHRISAVVMMTLGIYHIIYLFVTKRGKEVLRHLVPRLDDGKEAFQNMLYYFKLRKRPPEFSKFDYTEKAEYWALIWGTVIMGITGLILWFPTLVGDWAPLWLIKVSEIIHFYEAILASLAILVWHWFFVIFRPSEYPMSFVWIDGKMSLHRYRHHHEKHFKEILLDWMEMKEGKKTKKDLSHSTILFTNTMEKHNVNPDEIFSTELHNDPGLRDWLNEQLDKS